MCSLYASVEWETVYRLKQDACHHIYILKKFFAMFASSQRCSNNYKFSKSLNTHTSPRFSYLRTNKSATRDSTKKAKLVSHDNYGALNDCLEFSLRSVLKDRSSSLHGSFSPLDEMGAISILSLLSVVVALVLYLVRTKFSYWKDMGVPYVEPTFPYGNMQGNGKTMHQSQVMEKLYHKLKAFGTPFVGIYIYFSPAVLITSLDFVRSVMVKDNAHFTDRGVYYNEDDG